MEGSYSPRPQGGTTAVTVPATYNGPSWRGYFSTDGAANTECDEGEYQPSFYAQECIPCQAGSYCNSKAIGRFDGQNNLCPAGYQCQEGAKDYQTQAKCPTGHFSELGSPHCMLCADGLFTTTDPTKCKACTAGYYCNSKSLVPQACTTPSLCKGGDPVDPLCDDGSYFQKSTNLCKQCEAGSYCIGGVIAGLCTAGHLCPKGSSTPVPDTMCSIGYYCLHGAASQSPCPSGYFRSTRGGI